MGLGCPLSGMPGVWAGGGFTPRRKGANDAHLVLLVDGVYLSSAIGAPPFARPSLLVYNPPGTTHRDRFHGLDGRFFTISVSRERLEHVSRFATPVESAVAFTSGPALALAERLFRECRRWDAASALVAEGVSLELMAEMTRVHERRHRKLPVWLKPARELLHDRCRENVRISDIARHAGVHPIHLARTFREFFGCTPGDYLRRCRLESAARMLAEDQIPIAAIAAAAGFADQSHFSKAFRRAYSQSPRDYRRAQVS